ncbi:MAG: isochorismatase family protein [Gammaproteobacteria bacterium]
MKPLLIDQKQYVASLDVHAQNTFTPLCPQELPVAEGDQIVNALNQQATLAAKRIGSKEAHHPQALWVADAEHPQLTAVEGDNVDVRWRPHSIVGSEGFNLISGLPEIGDYDFFIWQGIELDMHPYGVCYHDFAEKLSTGIIEYLGLHHINTVIIGGLATDYCVKTSTLQLRRAGFNTIVNLAACRGLAEKTTQAALEEMQQAGVVLVDNMAAMVNAK